MLGFKHRRRYIKKRDIFVCLGSIHLILEHVKRFYFYTSTVHSLLFTILTNDCTIISNRIITNNMLLHVSTFEMSSSGSSSCLVKITYKFSGLSKIKLLKYKMINFNKTLIVQRNKRFAQWLYMQALLMLWPCLPAV